MKRAKMPNLFVKEAADWTWLLCGDTIEVLREMKPDTVDCVVTSPPYWGLRSYLKTGHGRKHLEIGTEKSPYDYVDKLRDVFSEVRRVLKPSGTLWLNIGDTYTANRTYQVSDNKWKNLEKNEGMKVPAGLKQKELIGIPWRVAFALQEDGWYLRQDIIWQKPNPLPESVRDRCTKSHEYVFLFSKSPKYFFDAEAIKEPIAEDTAKRYEYKWTGAFKAQRNGMPIPDKRGPKILGPNQMNLTPTRNKRDVWSIPVCSFRAEKYGGTEHFAVFPPRLVEPMVLAGTSEHGVCSACGAPWVREITKSPDNTGYPNGPGGKQHRRNSDRNESKSPGNLSEVRAYSSSTVGWKPSCGCENANSTRAIVLDPFCGSGTVGVAALKNGRGFIGIDINEDFLSLAKARMEEEAK